MTDKTKIWMKGIFAGAISGASGGIMNGIGSIAISPATFNFQNGIYNLLLMTAWGVGSGALIGVAGYLKQSPLPC